MLDQEKVEELKEFLSQFKQFECPAKYYVAWKVLIDNDESLTNTQFDYISHAYQCMVDDVERKIKY
jgi:hypothetical protein